MKYTLNDKEIELSKMPGFYIVELNGEDMKSTLRYIVK